MKAGNGWFKVFLFVILGLVSFTSSITTTHHDKPPEANLAIMASTMKREELLRYNVSLPASERQKRLLPYMNFYLKHSFNQPNQGSYIVSPQHYHLVPPKQSAAFQAFHHKFNELTGANYQPKLTDSQVPHQPKVQLTPFLESNALPGPFTPMRTQVNYTPLQQHHQITKVPNYSAIYDKLSQLKQLQQSGHVATTHNQNTHYNIPQYVYNYVRQPQINYIPIREFQQQDVQDYKTEQPAKTIIQTYTPKQVDIPTAPANYEQNYENSYIERPLYTAYKPHNQKQNLQEEILPQPIVVYDHKPSRTQQTITKEEREKIFLQQLKIYEEQRRINQYTEPPQVFGQKIVPPKPNTATSYETLPPNYQLIYTPNHEPEYISKSEKTQHAKYEVVSRPKFVIISEPKQTTPTPQFLIIENIETTPVQKYHQIFSSYKPRTKVEQIQTMENAEPAQQVYEPIENYQTLHKIATAPADKYEPVTELQPEYQPSPSTDHQKAYLPTDNPNVLSEILKNLQDSNMLPPTLTPDNIDNSIRTLVRILNVLKKQQKLSKKPIVVPDDEITKDYGNVYDNEAGVGLGGSHGDIVDTITQTFPADTEEGGTPGKPGVDYPALSTIPQTSFSCKTQRYKGFFGDTDTHCQVWHYCDFNGGQASFLCPNGTIFSQVALTCDWWYNVKCAATPQLYVLNERLYKYILPFSPKFPEDYSGPLVDRYLALKFQEMEEKMKKERKKPKVPKDEDAKKEESQQDDADELNIENMKNSKEIDYVVGFREKDS